LAPGAPKIISGNPSPAALIANPDKDPLIPVIKKPLVAAVEDGEVARVLTSIEDGKLASFPPIYNNIITCADLDIIYIYSYLNSLP
jgi:hypothetical protein